MRKCDIEAYLVNHCPADDRPGDLVAAINLIAHFCKLKSLDELAPYSLDVANAMATIFVNTASVRINRAMHNVDLMQRLRCEALDKGSYEKAYRSVSGAGEVKSERLRQINKGLFADKALAEFIYAAKGGLAIAPEQLQAAQRRATQISRWLRTKGNSGDEKRAQLGLSGWRDLGRSDYHEEIYQDVEVHLSKKMRPCEAYRLVAEMAGQQEGNVKKIHQRKKSNVQHDIEAVAKAAGVHPAVLKDTASWSNHPRPLPGAAPATTFSPGSFCEPAHPYTDPHDPPP